MHGNSLCRLARLTGGWPRPPAAAILVYHRLAEHRGGHGPCVQRANFREHLAAIREFFRPDSLEQLGARLRTGRLARRSVAITFDDGYRDTLEYARSDLAEFEATATAFLVTGTLDCPGAKFWWDELAALVLDCASWPKTLEIDLGTTVIHATAGADGKAPPGTWRRLNRYCKTAVPRARENLLAQLRTACGAPDSARLPGLVRAGDLARLGAGGVIDFGVHSASHPVLGLLSDTEQHREIAGARARLRELGAGEARAFAYPHGGVEDFSPRTVELVREAGYASACTAIPGLAGAGTDPLRLPRLTVGDWRGEDLAARLARLFLTGAW